MPLLPDELLPPVLPLPELPLLADDVDDAVLPEVLELAEVLELELEAEAELPDELELAVVPLLLPALPAEVVAVGPMLVPVDDDEVALEPQAVEISVTSTAAIGVARMRIHSPCGGARLGAPEIRAQGEGLPGGRTYLSGYPGRAPCCAYSRISPSYADGSGNFSNECFAGVVAQGSFSLV